MNSRQRRLDLRAAMREFKELADTDQSKMLADLVETVAQVERRNENLRKRLNELQAKEGA